MKTRASHPVRIARATLLALILVCLGAALGFCQERCSNWMDEVATSVESSPNWAHSVGWIDSYSQAAMQSANTGQPIMLVFTGSDWCGYCKRLESEVFNSVEFNEWSKKVVKVEVDFPANSTLPPEVTAQNQWLKEKYEGVVTSYPTILFVNSDGNMIAKTGYVSGGASNWISQTDQILPSTGPLSNVEQIAVK